MSRTRGFRARGVRFSRPQGIAALCIISVVCTISDSAFGQRRSARGRPGSSSRDADGTGPGAVDRGGYGGGYGGVANSRGADGRSGADATKGPATYPPRAVDSSQGALAEYQKPTYEHYRFVLSPDGTKLVLSGSHRQKEPAAATGRTDKAKVSASGKSKVVAHVLEVVDVPTGRSLFAFQPPTLFENLALARDNRFLAAESTDRPGVVSVLHLPTRKSKEFKTELRRIVPGGIVFSTDGRSINVVAPDRLLTIALADGQTKELKYESITPAATYCAATNQVAAGVSRTRQGTPEVQIYDVAAGKQTEQLEVPSVPTRVQFSPDGKWLAAAMAGGAVRVWQTSDWSTVGSVTGKIGFEPGQLAVSPDGGLVAVRARSAYREETRVVDIKSGEVVERVRTHDVYFLPSGVLAVAAANGPFYMDMSTGTLTELPPAAAADAALAQSDAATSPDTSTQSQVGYGDSGPPPSSQAGYGEFSPPPASQQDASKSSYGR